MLSNSYTYFKEVKDQRLVAEIAMLRGQLALKKNNPITAETFFIEGFIIHKENDQPFEAAQGALEITKLELYKNKPEKALFYIEEANTLNQAAENSKLRQELLFYKAQAYSQKGNYKEAYRYSSQSKKLKDSLQKIQSAEKIKEIEGIYQTERRDKEIALLTYQKKLAEEQKSNQRNLFIAGISVTSIAALFFFFQYINRQKINKKLRELDTAKSTFFTNISHDFRTPLTLIKGPIEDQLEDASLSLNRRKNLNVAYSNTERLENLVDQLMSLSKLNSSAMPLQVQPILVDPFLQVYTEGFQYQSEEQGFQFSLNTQIEESETWLDQDVLEKILYNLLGNALKYTSENGKIEVNGTTKMGVFQLSVYNSARALSEKEKELLFTRFYQTNTKNQGTGIGLSLIKQLVTLHKGTISVENEKEGILFTVHIPTEKALYNPDEILNEALRAKTLPAETLHEEDSQLIEINNDAPVLLVVDDTKEIRDYIQSIFQEKFNVLMAKDGEEGRAIAKEHIPDIIISDIVMPIMDGYALTKHIKEDPITSHIPIILLTAKNKEVDQLEAMGLGADIYTTKPFSPKLLRANVENLIENRRKLQERFAQELILTPKEIAVTTADEEFLNRLQEVLNEYLTQPDFTAAKFSKVMLMNRMQLHRKLKALTGLSSSEFIKNQRLVMAAQLIKTKDLNISEVGYSIGFNDPSYFAKCFKQEFGVSPKEFAVKNEE
ncbi:MAG: response regulator [Flavobacteriaceae bacterium]|nr:response regulator [Flavobacteriaceae bacterium]